jgi:hypothetical protein
VTKEELGMKGFMPRGKVLDRVWASKALELKEELSAEWYQAAVTHRGGKSWCIEVKVVLHVEGRIQSHEGEEQFTHVVGAVCS